MTKLRILLADDHAMVREGLAMLIAAEPDMEVVAQARGGREALQLSQLNQPDVAVLDVSMPDLGGAEVAEQIQQSCPDVQIVALTRHTETGYLHRMWRAGASGYVLKRTAANALINALRTVAGGGTYIDPSFSGRLADSAIGRSEASARPVAAGVLSERETQVLKAIAWGRSNKEIAAQLGLSVKTVESYKATAQGKLKLRSRTDILRYALANEWLTEDNDPD